MQRVFCDLCGKEIGKSELVGGIMRMKIVYPLNLTNTKTNHTHLPETWDLCQDCTSYVWTEAEKRQKALRNAKKDEK